MVELRRHADDVLPAWQRGWQRRNFLIRRLLALTAFSLAYHSSGLPNVPTASVGVFVTLLAAAVGVLAARGPARRRPAFVLGTTAVGTLLALVVGVARWLDELQIPWLAFVLAPVALWFAWPGRSLSATRTGALTLALALLVGTIAANPFGSRILESHVVVMVLLLLAHGISQVASRSAVAVERRGQPVTARTPPALRTIAWLVLVLLLAWPLRALLEQGAGRIERWRSPPTTESQSAAAWRELVGLERPKLDDPPLFEVRRWTAAPPDADPALYLRTHVLDELTVLDGVPWLTRRDGNSRTIRDSDDGQRDGEIAWVETDSAVEFEITLLAEEPNWMPMVPRLARLGLESVTLGPENAFERSASTPPTYRLASLPDLHRPPWVAGWTGRRGSQERYLPGGFDERDALRHWLREVCDDRLGADSDASDGMRLERLSDRLSTRNWAGVSDVFSGNYLPILRGEVLATSLEEAQAIAIACRLLGIPARVAMGFRAHARSDEPTVWRVRRSDRHAWVEVEFEQTGWIALEDEAAPQDAAPEPSASESNFLADRAGEPNLGASSPAGTTSEADSPTPASDSTALRAGLWCLVMLAGGAGAWWWRRRAFHDAAAAARARRKTALPRTRRARSPFAMWQKLLDNTRAAGFTKDPSWTGAEFVDLLGQRWPGSRGPARQLLETYERCRFGGRSLERAEERECRRSLRQVRRELRASPMRSSPQ